MAKQYDKKFFIREYYGTVKPIMNELGQTESLRDRLNVVGTMYMVCTTPGEEEMSETTERYNYTIDLTDQRDPIFGQIAEQLEFMTPKIMQAIQIQSSFEVTVEEGPEATEVIIEQPTTDEPINEPVIE